MDTPHAVRLGPQGRIVVPAEIRRRLGLVEGAELAASIDGDRVILEPREAVLRRARGRFRHVRVSLAAELADDRRRRAQEEDTS
jgi:AbrB family looped-hinge helix DNA binding protein